LTVRTSLSTTRSEGFSASISGNSHFAEQFKKLVTSERILPVSPQTLRSLNLRRFKRPGTMGDFFSLA
jgi:hypothetical protein